MRVVVNAVPARGTSLGVVTENLLRGWVGLGLDDELHLVLRSGVELDVGDGVQVHRVDGSRSAAMEIRVPALCRRLHADALLGLTPATTMAPLPCPAPSSPSISATRPGPSSSAAGGACCAG